MFATYRVRLIAYTAMLLVFLLATMSYSYFYTRKVILNEANSSVANATQLLTSNINAEERELLHYTEIVRDDLRIKEYMFMVVKIGTENKPLADLYNRQFGWLPVSRQIIISNTGRLVLGEQHQDLAAHILSHRELSNTNVFYVESKQGLEMVAWAAIHYQGAKLGIIAHSYKINDHWLNKHKYFNSGSLFIEKDGQIIASTVANSIGKPFHVENNLIDLNTRRYHVHPIQLSGEINANLKIWHGITKRELMITLGEHQRFVMLLIITGSVGILWVGLIIVRNLNRPLSELMHITRAVADGNLPVVELSEHKDEIAMLKNQFAIMLQALRDKQTEIDKVHKELEQSATTDSLTQLYNRRYLQEMFPRFFAQAQRNAQVLAAILMDLDYFKQINDQYGHLTGDQCLTHFSLLLKDNSRSNDFCFRIGGEEFLLLCIHDNQAAAEAVAEKIRQALERRPAVFHDSIVPMTVSIGVAYANLENNAEEALAQLLYNCDKALYQAKDHGRNQVNIYPTDQTDVQPSWDYVS